MEDGKLRIPVGAAEGRKKRRRPCDANAIICVRAWGMKSRPALDVALENLGDLVLWHGANDLIGHLAILEDQ